MELTFLRAVSYDVLVHGCQGRSPYQQCLAICDVYSLEVGGCIGHWETEDKKPSQIIEEEKEEYTTTIKKEKQNH